MTVNETDFLSTYQNDLYAGLVEMESRSEPQSECNVRVPRRSGEVEDAIKESPYVKRII